MVSTSARHEAIALIESVLNELQSPSRDLVALLRKCQTACTLLGRQEAEWIRRELDGYPPDTELPAHRRVAATLSWTISGPLYEIQRWMTGCLVYGRPLEDEDQVTTYEVRPGAIHFPSWTTTGYSFRTGEHKRSWDLSAKGKSNYFRLVPLQALSFLQFLLI
jgi:hypothetical protein